MKMKMKNLVNRRGFFKVKKVYSFCSLNILNKIIAKSNKNFLDGRI